MTKLLSILAVSLAFMFAPFAQAQGTSAHVSELIASFQASVDAISGDAAAAEALNAEADALDIQAEALRTQLQDVEALASAKRVEAVAALTVNEVARAEAEAIWKQLGTYLLFALPAPPGDPVDPVVTLDAIGASTTPGAGALVVSDGVWTITAAGQLTKDGVLLAVTNGVTSLVVEESALDATKTAVRQFGHNTSWAYAPGHALANTDGWIVAGATAPIVPPVDPTPVDPTAVTLNTFSTSPTPRWVYSGVYHPIEGPQTGKMPDTFSLDYFYIVPTALGELVHKLDANKGSAIKWEQEKSLHRTQGHYIVEATMDSQHPGVVYAPLWLYSEGASEPYHEYDFEIMTGRVEYNLHNGNGGFNMRKVNKDLTGHRVRYEIIRRPDLVTMRVTSLTDGWTDSLEITPAKVTQWAAQPGAPANLRFPANTIAMFPVTEFWRCRWPTWCGTWQDLPAGETVDMTIHGYAVIP